MRSAIRCSVAVAAMALATGCGGDRQSEFEPQHIDRRQLWHDDLTNEQFFGVVAADPGSKPAVVLDGKDDKWDKNGSQVIGNVGRAGA